jgi:hypothetical protein
MLLGRIYLPEILIVVSDRVPILLLGWLAQYFVYDAVFHRLFSAQIEVSVGVVGNLFHRLAGVFSYDVTYHFLHPHYFSGGNFNVSRLPLSTANRLVQMYGRIR